MSFAELVAALEGLGAAGVPLLARHFNDHGLDSLPLLLGQLPPRQSIKKIEAELNIDQALVDQSLPHVGDRLETLALLADIPLLDLKIRAGRFKPPVGPRTIFTALATHWQVPFHEAVARHYGFPFQAVPPLGENSKPPYEWDWPGIRLQMGSGKAIGTDGQDWSKALADHTDFEGHLEAMVVADGMAKADLKKALAAGKATPRFIVHRVFAGVAPSCFEAAQPMAALDFAAAPPGVSGAIAKGAGSDEGWVKISAPARRVILAVTGYEQRGKALYLSLAADKEGVLVPLAKAEVTGPLAAAILAHGKKLGVTRHGPVRAFNPLGPLPHVLCRAHGLQPAPRRKAGVWLGDVIVIGETDRQADMLENIVATFS
ncbi:MAG: hypothetical protein ACPG06_02345 [Alphaproteobacteria bacterium]